MIYKLKALFFTNGDTRKTVFKNFLWLSMSQVGSRIIRAAITIYSARALGATQYGIYSYAMGLAGFFIFFKNIGIDSIMTRDIAKDPASREKIFSTGFWIEIVLLVITAFLLLFVAPLFSAVPDAIVLLPVIAVILIADDLRDFFVAFFRGIEKMEWEAIVITIANVLMTVFGFAALALAKTPLSLAASYAAAATLVTFITGGIIFWRYGLGVIRNFTRALVVPILNAAWPIAASALPSIFLFNVDLVMLGWWRPVSEVGVYAAAQKVIGILAIFPGLISISTFPVFARLAHQKDVGRTRELAESVLRIMFAFSIPVVAGGSLLAVPLLGYLFGSEYMYGANAFMILLLSIFSMYPLAIFSNYVFVHDLQRKAVLYPFISAGTNLLLNYLLVPRFGMVGASLASFVSFFIYAWSMKRLMCSVQPFAVFRNPMKILISTLGMVCMTGALMFIGVHVLVNVSISAVLYLGFLVAQKDESLSEALALFKK